MEVSPAGNSMLEVVSITSDRLTQEALIMKRLLKLSENQEVDVFQLCSLYSEIEKKLYKMKMPISERSKQVKAHFERKRRGFKSVLNTEQFERYVAQIEPLKLNKNYLIRCW